MPCWSPQTYSTQTPASHMINAARSLRNPADLSDCSYGSQVTSVAYHEAYPTYLGTLSAHHWRPSRTAAVTAPAAPHAPCDTERSHSSCARRHCTIPRREPSDQMAHNAASCHERRRARRPGAPDTSAATASAGAAGEPGDSADRHSGKDGSPGALRAVINCSGPILFILLGFRRALKTSRCENLAG